ncbi:MAG: MarR family transcriptional regulator [Nanoarchaeota archaeon]|nr:MarR family transcriptional regulator [Nanoarchaeota archaeon]MCG2717996.1 MarR family transcriptional regulator [Nanoarchaeota archaeon]
MKNRIVGLVLIGVSIMVGFIIYSFNRALGKIVNNTCSHGSECPMWGTIEFQTNVSIGIMAFIILIGIYLVFFGKEKTTISKEAKKISKEEYKKVLAKMVEAEKKVFEKIIESEGSIFQSELIEKTGFTKVKVTRILDKLEGRGLIERKRRGMTNVVILKHK